MTETDDVEVTHQMKEINDVVPDALDCDNINPNVTLMDQIKKSSEKIQQFERQLKKKDRIIKVMKIKHKI